MTPRAPAAALLIIAAALGGCDEGTPTAACPLLAPGALADLRVITADTAAPTVLPELGLEEGGRVAVVFHVTGPARVAATGAGAGSLIAYGPRNTFGGFGHCLAIGEGRLTFDATAAGEHLVLVDTRGRAGLSLDLALTSSSPAPSAPACPTLAELGCPAVRCDGELALDDDGCLTCNCAAGALCGPERAAGPGGSCVVPACECPEGAAVCGADGRTWASACEAECHGVPVAREGACEAVCPEVLACETGGCFGLRRLAPESGCPTCACQPTFAQEAVSCAACPVDPAPVCGSDGRTWLNACRARCAGARILYAGACDPTCTRAPDGCTLDCAHGLVPEEAAGAGECLRCACASAPPLDCPRFGANACVTFGDGRLETTVASACVAGALGADGGVWGACGVSCERDEDCDGAGGGSGRCQREGFLAGRCLASDLDDCNCGDLLDPVCASSGTTWPNLCALRCAGEALLHLGACCEAAPPSCAEGEVVDHDPRGCPTGACVDADAARRGRGCAGNAAVAPACAADGTPMTTSACEAALGGVMLWPEGCR